MSSSDVSDAWRLKYADLLQPIAEGRRAAAQKLALAERNLERARRALAADPDGAIISAEAAMVNAADAVLARDGMRLRGKTGSHEARVAYPRLPAEFGRELRVITAARRARNIALYDEADRGSQDLARESIRVAELLLRAVSRAV